MYRHWVLATSLIFCTCLNHPLFAESPDPAQNSQNPTPYKVEPVEIPTTEILVTSPDANDEQLSITMGQAPAADLETSLSLDTLEKSDDSASTTAAGQSELPASTELVDSPTTEILVTSPDISNEPLSITSETSLSLDTLEKSDDSASTTTAGQSELPTPTELVDNPTTEVLVTSPDTSDEPLSITAAQTPAPSFPLTTDSGSIDISQMRQENDGCTSTYHNCHVGLRHNEAKGIGYNEGYTTLEGFGIYDQFGDTFLPFFDLRGHVFNDGKLAANAGVGARSLLSSINHFFGAYVYYDVRQAKHLTVQQISPGVEVLGRVMEYRVNAYLPLGRTKSQAYDFRFGKFKGNNLILRASQQRAWGGADGEIGGHFIQTSFYDVFGGAGPYFLSGDGSLWGGKARILGRYKEYVSIELQTSYDPVFKGIFQGSIAFTLPFGPKLKKKQSSSQNCGQLLSRATISPSRLEIPVVKKSSHKKLAINPATGLPWRIFFVNNTSHSAGTFESPYATLVAAQNASSTGDAIYIFPGDGSTTGMDQGILLKDQQKLFGAGIDQVFPTTHGLITAPSQSTSLPLITNTILNVSAVTLGNDCEVAGLHISNTNGGNGINGGDPQCIPAVVGIVDAYIHDNILTNCKVINGAISFHDCQGNLIVENNYISNVTVGVCTAIGINFFNSTVPENSSIVIANNQVYNTSYYAIGVAQEPPGGHINARIENNVISGVALNGFGHGIYFARASAAGSPTMCGTITGNVINNVAQSGIFINSTGSSSIFADVSNNIITNSTLTSFSANSLNSSSLQDTCKVIS